MLAVGLGDLNAVGRWVTVFFLTLYIAINLAAVIERLVGDLSYRPTIKVHWIISLFGCIGAGVVMFLINPIACVIAISVEIADILVSQKKCFKKQLGRCKGRSLEFNSQNCFDKTERKTFHCQKLASKYPVIFIQSFQIDEINPYRKLVQSK